MANSLKVRAPLIETSATEIFRVAAPDVMQDQYHISFDPPVSPEKLQRYDPTGNNQHPIFATIVDSRGLVKKLVYERNFWGWNEKHRGKDFKRFHMQFTRRLGYNSPPGKFTHLGEEALVASGVHIEDDEQNLGQPNA